MVLPNTMQMFQYKIFHAQHMYGYDQFSVLLPQTNSLNHLPNLPIVEYLRKHRGPVRKSLKASIQLNSFLYTKLSVTLRYIIATERIKAGMKQIKKNIQKQ